MRSRFLLHFAQLLIDQIHRPDIAEIIRQVSKIFTVGGERCLLEDSSPTRIGS
jgi:hypothetical protein